MAPLGIAIPFYNNIAFLRTAIESVLAQTCPAWELIVVDDAGPEEGVDALIAAYQDTRIKYHRNSSNLGLAENWNRCVQLSKCEWLTLLHADDLLERDYVSTMQRYIAKQDNIDAFFCDARIIGANGKPIFSFPDVTKRILNPSFVAETTLRGEKAVAKLLRAPFIFCPTLCYRRQLLLARPFDSSWRMVLDLDFQINALIDGRTLLGIRKPLYLYRRHKNNQTEILQRDLHRFREEIAFYNQTAHICDSIGWTSAAKAARHKVIVRLHLVYHLVGCIVRLQPFRIVKIIKLILTN